MFCHWRKKLALLPFSNEEQAVRTQYDVVQAIAKKRALDSYIFWNVATHFRHSFCLCVLNGWDEAFVSV